MAEHKDEVFQVSLTEIAFTIILLLVMLLGTQLMLKQHENKLQEAELTSLKDKVADQNRKIEAQNRQIKDQKKKLSGFKSALSESERLGGLCRPDPDDPLDPMMACNKCVSVVGKISKTDAAKAIELGRRVVEQWKAQEAPPDFEAFSEMVQQAAFHAARGDKLVYEDEVINELRRLNQEADELKNKLALSAADQENLKKCLANNAYFRRRAGLDHPPCWVTENNRPAYLFNITLLPDNKVMIERGWPDAYTDKAEALAPVRAIAPSFGKAVPMKRFTPIIEAMREIGDNTKPEACRHFVRLKNTIPDRPSADRARYAVENGFYKYEVQ